MSMFTQQSIQMMHYAVDWLLQPVIYCLLFVVLAALWESGIALSERFGGLNKLVQQNNPDRSAAQGRRRIERADLLARIGPMLGLMGTLIPLGPGLAALGQGDLQTLARAVTVAFDTTVLGLLVGIAGFILGRLRRRWYDQLLDTLETRTQESTA
ncbi:MAG: MotA/TolQ/ExbB proton channel family protein [Thiohalophilus sp.]|nr:MotA/TolQ/ExbB proton channel family protein [Thiohalophilus sp.]MDZ7663652.1 MotA/TolQ/ExbB proton channel family protein [Thiohalophilus sp.]